MKKILVAGGAGFVGSHLCRKLLDQGNFVVCLDNLQTGNRDNIAPLMSDKNFRFLERDIVEPLWLDVEEIYNLACPASPIHYQENPVKTTVTSVMGAIRLLDLAKQNGAKILQASTSEIYGDPEINPQTENYWGHVNCIGVRSCYDEGKRAAETLFFDYRRQYGVAIRVIRIFNTYGPNMAQDDGRVISNFIIQALKDEDITIYGDGQQTRSFQYITDLINGMLAMMDNTADFIGPVNIGNPGEFTIKQLAELVIQMVPGTKSRIIYGPAAADDPRQRKPDITLAQEKLHWNPTVPLKEGLAETINYFRSQIKM